MPIITVSGHARKTGKTSVVEGLIAALPEYGWATLKISSHHHSGDPSKNCTVIEETDSDGGNDTSRFLKAGARRAFWIQTGQLKDAIPAVQAIINGSPNVVIEGNSILDFIAADFSILVVNRGVAEFKESATGILARADALVLIRANADRAEWETILKSAPKNIPQFETYDLKIFPPGLAEMLRSELALRAK